MTAIGIFLFNILHFVLYGKIIAIIRVILRFSNNQISLKRERDLTIWVHESYDSNFNKNDNDYNSVIHVICYTMFYDFLYAA